MYDIRMDKFQKITLPKKQDKRSRNYVLLDFSGLRGERKVVALLFFFIFLQKRMAQWNQATVSFVLLRFLCPCSPFKVFTIGISAHKWIIFPAFDIRSNPVYRNLILNTFNVIANEARSKWEALFRFNRELQGIKETFVWKGIDWQTADGLLLFFKPKKKKLRTKKKETYHSTFANRSIFIWTYTFCVPHGQINVNNTNIRIINNRDP